MHLRQGIYMLWSDLPPMAEGEDEKLLVLPLTGEAKKLTRVISNDTARDVLEALAARSRSASELAADLKVPLTTVQYNLERLIEVGLIKVENIRYSEKGKQVKVYAPVRRLIVVVPERTSSKDVMEALKRYLTLFVLAFIGTAMLALLATGYQVYPAENGYVATGGPSDFGLQPNATPAPPLQATPTYPMPGAEDLRGGEGTGWAWGINPALAFVAGALAVIAGVAVMEVWKAKSN